MAQGYYTLEEAARILSISEDELKLIARRGELRSFQDRGTWRFRVQDIQELARQRGMGSEPDLTLGEALSPIAKDSGSPSGSQLQGQPPEDEPEVFDFSLEADDEFTDIGKENLSGGSKSSRRSGSSRKGASSQKRAGPSSLHQGSSEPKSPAPGSDSDVRLVGDPGEDFGIRTETRVEVDKPDAGGKEEKPPKSKPDSSKKRLGPQSPTKPDSGVRLVKSDSDSDVRIIGTDSSEEISLGEDVPMSSSDSDVRMEFEIDESGEGEPGSLTEEINLDEEHQKWEEQQKKQSELRGKDSASPFELMDSDFSLPRTGSTIHPEDDSGSSEFELTPDADSSSPLDSSDFEIEADSGEELEQAPPTHTGGTKSGITLENPVDKGISLEQDNEGSADFKLGADTPHMSDSSSEFEIDEDPSSSSEFELNLDADDSSGEGLEVLDEDSSSEFELALDADDSPQASSSDFDMSLDSGSSEASFLTEDSSSEFELTLDDDSEAPSDSSEFELTIDADESGAPDLSSDSEFDLHLEGEGFDSDSEFELAIEGDDDSDIGTIELEESAEDDFPMLTEDESESEVVALDETDLDESEFEIEVEDSTSQVVALDDEEVEELVELGDKAEVGDDFGLLAGAVSEGGAMPEPETVVVEKQAAPWGVMPVAVMLPCVIVMVLVSIMSFELIQSMNGYERPGLLTKAIGGLINPDLNK